MDNKTEQQLNLIMQIFELLNSKNIPIWLAGGWALDFLCNRKFVNHDDIDLFIRKSDYDKLEKLLIDNGFEIVNKKYHQTYFIKDSLYLDIIKFEDFKNFISYVDLNGNKTFCLSENSFQLTNVYFHNSIKLLLISPLGQLILTKLLNQIFPEMKLRNKDLRNISLLENMFNLKNINIDYDKYGLKYLTS